MFVYDGPTRGTYVHTGDTIVAVEWIGTSFSKLRPVHITPLQIAYRVPQREEPGATIKELAQQFSDLFPDDWERYQWYNLKSFRKA